jgi:hypothetical protein
MDKFKEPTETKKRAKFVSSDDSTELPPHEHTDMPATTNSSDLSTAQRIDLIAKRSKVDPAATWLSLLGFLLVVLAIAFAARFLTNVASVQSTTTQDIVVMAKLKDFADKDILVKVKGIASPDSDSPNGSKVGYQFLRLTEPGKGGRSYESRYPQFISLTDKEDSILIDSSTLAEFVGNNEPADLSQIVTELRTPETMKVLLTPRLRIQLWTIKSGAEVTAEGRVVWDDQRKRYILKAPSLLAAPMSAGLTRLQTKNGPSTF